MSVDELYYSNLKDLWGKLGDSFNTMSGDANSASIGFSNLASSSNITGQGADAMKAYIEETHLNILSGIGMIVQGFLTSATLYVNNYDTVDSDGGFQLLKEDFDQHKSQLTRGKAEIENLAQTLMNISNSADNVVYLGGAGGYELQVAAEWMQTMHDVADKQETAWHDYEANDYGFDQTQDLIDQTRALIKQVLQIPRGRAYTAGSFMNLAGAFMNSYNALSNYCDQHQEEFQAAWDKLGKEEAQKEYAKQKAEYEKQQKAQEQRVKEQQEAQYYLEHPWELAWHPDKLGLVAKFLGQTFEYLAKHPGEAVKLGLDAIFAVSSIEKIMSGKAGLMDYVDVLLTYGGIIFSAGAAVVAKLGVAAMKIAKVACVVGKASEAVSALSKTGKVMRTLKTVDKIGNAVIKPLEKVKPVLNTVKEAKVVRGASKVMEHVNNFTDPAWLMSKGAEKIAPMAKATFAGAKTAGKTFVSGVGDLAKTANSFERIPITAAVSGSKAIVAGTKEAKAVYRTIKAQEKGLVRVLDDGTIEVHFNVKEHAKYVPEELHRQLHNQETGMNDLTIKEFLDNRAAFNQHGRAKKAAAIQKDFRQKAINQKAKEFRKADRNLTPEQAQKQAEIWAKDKAALHDPDMVAGGRADGITELGDKYANSSIGSQWKTRADAVEAYVKELSKGLTDEQKANMKLNVKLIGEKT